MFELHTWKRGDRRAPHKPLLLLLAIGAWQSGRALDWHIVKAELSQLLKQFGTLGTPSPQYPFIRLQNDGLWVVDGFADFKGDAKVTELTRINPGARLAPSVIDDLQANPTRLHEVVSELLYSHFPDAMHDAILEATGIQLGVVAVPGIETSTPAVDGSSRRHRDPEFRVEVLNAYNYQCAVCGYGARMNDGVVGLEAAHIQMHACNGPDTVTNGLALCSLHHTLFDYGAFTVTPSLNIEISTRINGPGAQDELYSYSSKEIWRVRNDELLPHPDHLNWHREEIFKG
jgi:putative restriction endonuclease